MSWLEIPKRAQAIEKHMLLGPKHLLLRTYYNGAWTLWDTAQSVQCWLFGRVSGDARPGARRTEPGWLCGGLLRLLLPH